MRTRAAVACSVILVLAGCSDDSTVGYQPARYNIYAAGSSWGRTSSDSCTMYVYDADRLELLDSLLFPYVAEEAVASPDGEHLYIVLREHSESFFPLLTLIRCDLPYESVVWAHTLPYSSPPCILDNGNILMCYPYIMNPNSGQVLNWQHRAPFSSWRLGTGPVNGTDVAAVVVHSPPNKSWDGAVVAVDVTNGEVRGLFAPPLAPDNLPMVIEQTTLHPDGQRVLCIGSDSNADNAWLLVGDLDSGAPLFTTPLSSPDVELAVSSDGAFAVVADPGAAGLGTGSPAILVVDLNSCQTLKRLERQDGLAYWPGRVRFLPGGRRVVLMPANTPERTGWIQTLDLNTLTLDIAVDMPRFEPSLGAFTVGPRVGD